MLENAVAEICASEDEMPFVTELFQVRDAS